MNAWSAQTPSGPGALCRSATRRTRSIGCPPSTGPQRLPFSLKVLLENLLRTEDGADITADDVRALAGWDPAAEPDREIRFTPARVVMQDFTGVPAVVDLATMREAMRDLGGDAAKINPLAPAELVIDHSVIADLFGTPDSFTRNVELEYERNYERYQFLRWGQGAFDDFKVVPPGTGIVHQVNIEYLARVVFTRDGAAYPDTLVGTDSHTTMVNGLGVLGWGVGGIEAEAAMLGQPVSMLIPRVVGFRLDGELPDGSTATDLVLTITEMLRKHGVVGKFVEFYGPGRRRRAAGQPGHDRQHVPRSTGRPARSSRSTTETLRYLRFTGRPEDQVALVEAYAKEQGLWHDPDAEPDYSETLSLDLSTHRAVAGRPEAPAGPGAAGRGEADVPRRAAATTPTSDGIQTARGRGRRRDVPGQRPGRRRRQRRRRRRRRSRPGRRAGGRASDPTKVTLEDGTETEIDHGAVVIAAITSCTNTSNPSVMIGAALLAKKAVERGLQRKPWVKTTLAPGLQGGHGLLRARRPHAVPGQARLQPRRLRLHHLHRQLRAAARAGVRRGQRGRPRGGLGAVRQPQLRGPDQPRREDELPRLAAAGRRLRAGRLDGHRHHHRAARHRTPTASRSTCATSGRRRPRSRRSSTPRSPARCSPGTTPTCSPATSAGRRCRPRPATRSRGTPSRPTSASRRTSTACSASRRRSPTSPARGCWPSSATR